MYLAQKKDTKEVCALKVMSKKLLFKLDEIRHILTERDILTAAKSEWLVKLLYAFQDDQSIYLAMVGFQNRSALFERRSHSLLDRSMFREGTSAHCSTILGSFTTAMLDSTLPKCSRASTLSTN